ncbi:hypothetical protein [Botrimarina sp.]
MQTDWLSTIATLGVGFLPAAFRAFSRRASWTRSITPSRLHAQNVL